MLFKTHMATFFGSNSTSNITETNLGSRLYHIKEAAIGSESIVSILPDDNVVVNTCSSFGKSLLNVSSLNGLVGLLNSADSKVEVIDSGTGSIDFTLDNALKLSVKNLYTEVLNELRSLNIVPATDLEYNLGTSTKRYNYGYFRRIASNTSGQVAIGDGAGTAGTSSINIGFNAGGGTPDYSVSIGRSANTVGHTRSIAIGYASGQNGGTAFDYTTSIGFQAGFGVSGSSVNQMKTYATAIGYSAGMNGLGTSAIAIGTNSGAGTSGSALKDYGVSIGDSSARAGQGTNAIAIGYKAGETSSHDNSIILNATGVAVNSSGTDRCYIAPIRSNGTGNVLNYDTGSKEVLSGGNVSMQTLTSQGLNPDLLNSRNIGTISLPWNGVYCNGLVQPSATNSMTFNTNGAERLRITPTGNVGIGTTSAISLLDVSSSSINPTMTLATSNYTLNPVSATTVATFRMHNDKAQQDKFCDIKAVVRPSNHSPSIVFATKPTWDNAIIDRMIITEAGNIGINQASPQERLDVSGNVKITGNILFDADNQRSVGSSGQALSAIHCHTGNFKSIAVHSTTAGNIGTSAKPFDTLFVNNIGSSGTPVQTLYADVWATSATAGLRCANNLVLATDLSLPTITWYDVNAKSMILVDTVNTTDGGKLSYDSANSEIVIGTTSPSVERVRIGANGLKSKRAIHNTDATSGITSTDSQLQLSGATKSQILFENTGNTNKKVIALYNSADKLCINSMDNTGNTYTASGDIIQFDMANGWVIVNGLLRPTLDMGSDLGGTNKRWGNGYFDKVYTTSGTVNTSDRNQKKDIQPLGDSLKQLLKLEPVSFKYKEGTSGRTHLGFIAQQVAEVIPDCAIFVQNGDSCGLRYEQFSALIVKAVQELHSKVEKIEARKLVGGAVIDTSGLTEDFVRVYERLEALESEVNKPVKPQLHRCVEISRINELFQRISNIETQIHCNESKSNSSEDFELVHSLMDRNHEQELRINELSTKLVELENKLNNLPKGEAKNEIEDSDTGGLSMIESLQDRLFKAEQLAIKQDKMIKKLTTAVNKLLKQSE
jgi:hypothetical protein